MSTSFLVFFFPLLLENKDFCEEINHAVHKKAQLSTHLYNKTKKKRESNSSSSLVYVARLSGWMNERDDDHLFGCSVSWLCSHWRIVTKGEPLLKQQVGSIALRMLFCTEWVWSVLETAGETQEDRDFVACIAEKVTDWYSSWTEQHQTSTGSVGPIANTQNSKERLMVICI